MGTIAEKLSYLDTTREKILTETNRLGVGLTEQDKFRDYAKGLHNGYVDLINNGTDKLYDNMEKVSGSGSDITLENTEVAPMESEFEGDTYQETTSGKNLFDKDNANILNSTWLDSNRISRDSATKTLYIPIKGGETYTVSKILSARFTIATSSDLPALSVSISNRVKNNSATSLTLTSSATANYLCVYYYNSNVDTLTEQEILDSIQIEQGSTAADFEPYTGGQPSPNPDYPQEIEVVTGRQEIDVCGKNLFSSNEAITITKVSSSNRTVTITLDNPIPAGTYTISKVVEQSTLSSPSSLYVAFVNGFTSLAYGSLANDLTLTTIADTNKITFYIIKTETDGVSITFKDIQIEHGSTASEYEEFKEQSYEINLGKNLLPNNQTTQTINGITFTINQDKSITLSGTSSDTTYLYLVGSENEYEDLELSTGNYNLSGVIGGSNYTYMLYVIQNRNGDLSYYQSTNNNGLVLSIQSGDTFKIFIRVLSSQTLNTTIYPMLEKGSQATSYSAYKTPIELCKINTYKDRIFRGKGVNLFDKDNANIINGNVNNDNVASSTNAKTLWIPIKGGNTYTISKIKSARFRIATTIQTPAIDVSTAQFDGTVDSNTTYTITTNSTANYLCVYYYLNGTDTLTEQQILDSIMINEGSTALPYEPYNAKDKWYLEKQIGKVVLDGSTNDGNWYANGSNCQLTFTNNKYVLNNTSIFSNYFKSTSYSSSELGIGMAQSGTTSYLRVNQGITQFGSISNFKTWLSTHNTTVYYQLATPTTTEITDSELISQLEEWYNQKSNKDVTYISVTSEDLPAILNINAIKQYE